jgi:hypothetical protein
MERAQANFETFLDRVAAKHPDDRGNPPDQ